MKPELDETAQMLDIAASYIAKAMNDGALRNCVISPLFVLEKIEKLLNRIGYDREFHNCVPKEKGE